VQNTELLIFGANIYFIKDNKNGKKSGCCGSKASLEEQISFDFTEIEAVIGISNCTWAKPGCMSF
jgi:hypothetical protein